MSGTQALPTGLSSKNMSWYDARRRWGKASDPAPHGKNSDPRESTARVTEYRRRARRVLGISPQACSTSRHLGVSEVTPSESGSQGRTPQGRLQRSCNSPVNLSLTLRSLCSPKPFISDRSESRATTCRSWIAEGGLRDAPPNRIADILSCHSRRQAQVVIMLFSETASTGQHPWTACLRPSVRCCYVSLSGIIPINPSSHKICYFAVNSGPRHFVTTSNRSQKYQFRTHTKIHGRLALLRPNTRLTIGPRGGGRAQCEFIRLAVRGSSLRCSSQSPPQRRALPRTSAELVVRHRRLRVMCCARGRSEAVFLPCFSWVPEGSAVR